ncbi:hypothetical protein GCM10010191_68850 [Actinomadura vinacea]|uniref:Uncharacterized protein n=1 Tax=Actinomadura vinacea TaxID=115336 RepID=A0ABP5X564_9ACTN
MRSRFADQPEQIVPRSLKQLLMSEDAQRSTRPKENARRRRPRKTQALRKSA